jgi:hypothetical protein
MHVQWMCQKSVYHLADVLTRSSSCPQARMAMRPYKLTCGVLLVMGNAKLLVMPKTWLEGFCTLCTWAQ